MNLFVLWDNSSRSANNQINPTCAQRFTINRGALKVICTHLGSLPLYLSLGFSGRRDPKGLRCPNGEALNQPLRNPRRKHLYAFKKGSIRCLNGDKMP